MILGGTRNVRKNTLGASVAFAILVLGFFGFVSCKQAVPIHTVTKKPSGDLWGESV